MKNICIFCIITIFPFSTLAQPVLTNSTNSPVVGDAFYLNICDTNGVESPGASGASVTWNFSYLVSELFDSTTVVSCTSTPYCDSFPGSNIAIGQYEYFITNVNEWAGTGIYYVGSGATYYPEPEKIISYPFTYNTNIVDTSTAYILGAAPLYKTEIDSVTGDAYGTLELPGSSYTNVLRMHLIGHITDSFTLSSGDTVFYIRSESYMWFQPGFHYELLEMDYDTSGGQQYLADVVYYMQNTTGIPLVNGTGLNLEVNPNPASDLINIRFNLSDNDNTIISLSDVSGRIVGTINNTAIKIGANEIAYPVSNLAAGIYFINLKSDSYNCTKKIVIVR